LPKSGGQTKAVLSPIVSCHAVSVAAAAAAAATCLNDYCHNSSDYFIARSPTGYDRWILSERESGCVNIPSEVAPSRELLAGCRRHMLLSCTTSEDVAAVLEDVSSLTAIPLLQALVFEL
jgi:hypothetical protein